MKSATATVVSRESRKREDFLISIDTPVSQVSQVSQSVRRLRKHGGATTGGW